MYYLNIRTFWAFFFFSQIEKEKHTKIVLENLKN